MPANLDPQTVEGFGHEWEQFDQSPSDRVDLQKHFEQYFRIFPWDNLPQNAIGFDAGCGSGRWARMVAPKVGHLYCIDASSKAVNVARKNLHRAENTQLILASVGELPLEDNSMDFGYSLGVLHHIPNTALGINGCVDKLKSGAPLLLYIYYAFDNKPIWYRWLWQFTNILRKLISKLPFKLKLLITQIIAFLVYFPLARTALLFENLGVNVASFPLSYYRDSSFYTMRTDALDRFGTQLEQRFTASQIQQMMEIAGLERIQFSDSVPYWCAVGYKK